MSPSDLCARIYALETQLEQAQYALRRERNRVAVLQDTCDAWAKAFGTRTARRQAALARPSDTLAPIAGGAPRRVPLPAFGARSYGTDDGEYQSFAEWSDRRAGRDSEDSYRD